MQLADYAKVFNQVDRGFGGEQGQAVGRFFVKQHFFDFDDVFAALGFAWQVKPHRYRAAVIEQFELVEDGEAETGGDVVDNSAGFDGFDT